MRAGVDLDAHAQLGSGFDHAVMVDGITVTAEQQPAGGMAEHPHRRMLHGFDQTLRRLRLGHVHAAVNGGDHKVETRQHFVGIVQPAVRQNVTFRAFENVKAFQLGIEAVDLLVLLLDALRRQSLGVGDRHAVVANAEVLEAQRPARLRHLGQ